MGGSKNKEEQITIFLISIAEEYSRQNSNIILVMKFFMKIVVD